MKTCKWNNKDVFVHHIAYSLVDEIDTPPVKFVLVGFSAERIKLFKVNVEELDLDGKKLETYLLGQVERNG